MFDFEEKSFIFFNNFKNFGNKGGINIILKTADITFFIFFKIPHSYSVNASPGVHYFLQNRKRIGHGRVEKFFLKEKGKISC